MTTPSFTYSHTIEANVSAAAIWSLYEDVATWPDWDAEAELVTRDGPFATGSTGTMKFAGVDALPYRLTRVEPLREFVDETPVGESLVTVSHRFEPLESGRLRITYAVTIDGERATQLGAMITADFPTTMASLVELARERSA